MKILNKNAKILFATFSPYSANQRGPTNGNIEPMISFFTPKVNQFTLIDQPHTGSDTVEPRIEDYQQGKLVKKGRVDFFLYRPFSWWLRALKRTANDTSILFKIRDLLSVLSVVIVGKTRYDYLIGLESINTLAGIILKKMGRVDKVIYYVSDYSPLRYQNKLFNQIYLFLDRFCCYHGDYVWDVSLAMAPARVKAGLEKKKSKPIIHVPNGLMPKFIKHLSLEQLEPYSLVFMGTLVTENGPDLAIEALKIVLEKIPQARLHIIGKEAESDSLRLKKLIQELGLSEKVVFHGFIPDDEEMYSKLRCFYLGLAPYLKIKNSVRWYGDSLKLRAYMASGLPVITTEVPPLGRELARQGAAVLVEDNKKALAQAIIKILSNPGLYQKYRIQAIKFGENNTWENTYLSAFKEMEKINEKN